MKRRPTSIFIETIYIYNYIYIPIPIPIDRFSVKSTICVSLDTDLVIEMRKRNDNFSGVVNQFLKEYLGTEEEEKDRSIDNLDLDITNAKIKLEGLQSAKNHAVKKQFEKYDKVLEIEDEPIAK